MSGFAGTSQPRLREYGSLTAFITEDEYWVRLEFRLCEEFAGLPERRYRFFWCDGLVPEEYLLRGPAPRIDGRAWIGNGPRKQYRWSFALLLPAPAERVEDIDWAALLPSEGTTCWMCFDEAKRHLEIDPATARPDLA